MTLEYRPCVIAVFTNGDGRVLVAERSDAPGQWQLPQGGVDPGESPEQALRREMAEELGTDQFRILARGERPICYDFPPDLQAGIAKRFRGQKQQWFHVAFAEGARPDLERAEDDEFRDVAWVPVQDVVEAIIDFKKDAYREGLRMLGFSVGKAP